VDNGRLLAYVDSRLGDLGERQLRAGLASVYRYRGRRFSRLGRYQRTEDDARDDRRATWSSCGGGFHSPIGGASRLWGASRGPPTPP